MSPNIFGTNAYKTFDSFTALIYILNMCNYDHVYNLLYMIPATDKFDYVFSENGLTYHRNGKQVIKTVSYL